MAGGIKQPDNVGRVLPLNRSRDPGRKKRPPDVPDKPQPEKRDRRPPDDSSPHIDEYA